MQLKPETEDSANRIDDSSSVATDSPEAAYPTRKKGRLLRRFVLFIIWLVIIVVMVVMALMISAWLTGFRTATGGPDVIAMLKWIQANFNLPK